MRVGSSRFSMKPESYNVIVVNHRFHGPLRVTFDDQTQNFILSFHNNKAIQFEFDGHGLHRAKNNFRIRVVRLGSEVSIVIFTIAIYDANPLDGLPSNKSSMWTKTE